MTLTIKIQTDKHEGLYDITGSVNSVVNNSDITNGIVSVFARGATAAIMIQENWDDSVQNDVVSLLRKLIPSGIWEHDRQDNNGDSHLKAGLVGPSETIPIIDGKMALSTWQNIFFCEFDGPRSSREIAVTIIST
jgi:secondary thiamine-phosphate synthase enzyme